MVRKKRFGVSIENSIAYELDKLAENLEIDRSRLVEKALKNLITEYNHIHDDHLCRGVIIVETSEGNKVDKAIENFKDVVLSYTHNHLENKCVCMIIVSGSSQRIKDLQKNLISLDCETRYIPLTHS